MKLLLADDHTLFRDALVQFIERAEPGAIVMLAKDLHEVMEIMAGGASPDLILLDLRMPGMDGLAGLEKLKATYPAIPVALLSGLAEKHHVEKAMALGACGFFPKTMSGKAMLAGVHRIMAGEDFIALDHNTNRIMPAYFDGRSADASAADPVANGHIQSAGARLTPREKQVLEHLTRGASNKDIADALDLQVVTVKLHVRGICRKLGAKNRTQAALKAQENATYGTVHNARGTL